MGQLSSGFIVTYYEFLFVLHLSWAKGRDHGWLPDQSTGPDAVLAGYAVRCKWQSSHGQNPVPCLRAFKASRLGTVVGIA